MHRLLDYYIYKVCFQRKIFRLSKCLFPVGSVLFANRCLHLKYCHLKNIIIAVVLVFLFLNSRYEKVPVILVGNKVDLESEREVSLSEGRALAEEWGCPFMETSAKSKTMVDELFAEIVRQMNYAAQPDKDDPCCSACNIQ